VQAELAGFLEVIRPPLRRVDGPVTVVAGVKLCPILPIGTAVGTSRKGCTVAVGRPAIDP
jgi:hypothetical protein